MLSDSFRLLGIGIPLLWLGLKTEDTTEKILGNIELFRKSDKKIVNKLRNNFILFLALTIVFIPIQILFANLILEIILYSCLGLALYFSLSWFIEKIPFLKSQKDKKAKNNYLK